MYAYFVICSLLLNLPAWVHQRRIHNEWRRKVVPDTMYLLLLRVKAIQASAKFKYNYYKGHPHPIDSSIDEG